tara:strand:- start:158 stop:310 length:153 start_codon:yes stop_codon:yes gene_type:complete
MTESKLAEAWWDEGINPITGYKTSTRKNHKDASTDEIKYFNAYPTLNIKQ